MYMTINARLQRLAIEKNVPAWNVMIDHRRAAFSNETKKELVLLNRAGGTVFSVRESTHNAWEQMEKAMLEYSGTEECQTDWRRYDGEGRPVVGFLGVPL